MFAKALPKRSFSASVLKEKMSHIISGRQQELIAFRKEHANTVIGDVTVGAVLGGMRGLPGMLWETSKLHAENGISYRGHDLFDIRENGNKTVAGGQPTPEGALWLLLTGEFASDSEHAAFKEDLFHRGALTDEEETLIKSFPKDMHAMT
jgi:citrate synthase